MRFNIIDRNGSVWILNFLDTDSSKGGLSHNGQYIGQFSEVEAKAHVEHETGGPVQMSRVD